MRCAQVHKTSTEASCVRQSGVSSRPDDWSTLRGGYPEDRWSGLHIMASFSMGDRHTHTPRGRTPTTLVEEDVVWRLQRVEEYSPLIA
jgi:hypothetical protein